MSKKISATLLLIALTSWAKSPNTCLLPLVWQTHDVDYRSAVTRNRVDIRNAQIAARLNGILIHENYQFSGTTGGMRNEPGDTPEPIKLQGHSDPPQFRNIWVIEK